MRNHEGYVSALLRHSNVLQTDLIAECPVAHYRRTLLPLISSGHPGFADGRDIVDFHDLMSPSFRQISVVRITLRVHQAQFVVGEIGGFSSAVDNVMAPVAGDRRLSIVRLASCAARTRQAVMRQHAGFRVAVAVTGDPHCTFAARAALRRFAILTPTSCCASESLAAADFCPPPAAR